MVSVNLRHQTNIAVYLILRKGSKVLLVRRANTGYQDGKYSLVAGHVEGRESIATAICREAKEEVGVKIHPKDLSLAHITHRLASDKKIYLDCFFKCAKWSGEIQNKEPHKCDDVSWHSHLSLPKNIIPHVRVAITTTNSYREIGFNKP